MAATVVGSVVDEAVEGKFALEDLIVVVVVAPADV